MSGADMRVVPNVTANQLGAAASWDADTRWPEGLNIKPEVKRAAPRAEGYSQ
jgi:hypothetical protein